MEIVHTYCNRLTMQYKWTAVEKIGAQVVQHRQHAATMCGAAAHLFVYVRSSLWAAFNDAAIPVINVVDSTRITLLSIDSCQLAVRAMIIRHTVNLISRGLAVVTGLGQQRHCVCCARCRLCCDGCPNIGRITGLARPSVRPSAISQPSLTMTALILC